jgi:CDP-4-dehydro-6-deoxyglucose reductase
VVQGQVDLGAVHPLHLNEADRKAGFALLCQATPRSDVTIEVEEIEAGGLVRSKFMPARVLEMRKLGADVMMLRVGLPMNEPTIFRAGQYLDFVRPDGDRRSYSIASAPSNDGSLHLELHLRHMPGGKFTDRVFGGGMELREVHRIEFPLGSFFLRETGSQPIVMLASGTGFAPIKSMMLDMIKRKIERPVTLYWGGRKRVDLYMADLCEQWAREHAWFKFVPVLSEPSPECRWDGRRGFVHQAVMDDLRDLSEYQVYACGTPAMVDAARRDFIESRHLSAHEFYADSFLTAKEKAATA